MSEVPSDVGETDSKGLGVAIEGRVLGFEGLSGEDGPVGTKETGCVEVWGFFPFDRIGENGGRIASWRSGPELRVPV